jgi:hypothetical protein
MRKTGFLMEVLMEISHEALNRIIDDLEDMPDGPMEEPTDPREVTAFMEDLDRLYGLRDD